MASPFDTEFCVGTVMEAEKFEEALKPELVKLWVDIEEEEIQSAAQLGYNHSVEDV